MDTIEGIINFCEEHGQPCESLKAMLATQAEERADVTDDSDLAMEVAHRENGYHLNVFQGDDLTMSVTGISRESLEPVLRGIDDLAYEPTNGAKQVIRLPTSWLTEQAA